MPTTSARKNQPDINKNQTETPKKKVKVEVKQEVNSDDNMDEEDDVETPEPPTRSTHAQTLEPETESDDEPNEEQSSEASESSNEDNQVKKKPAQKKPAVQNTEVSNGKTEKKKPVTKKVDKSTHLNWSSSKPPHFFLSDPKFHHIEYEEDKGQKKITKNSTWIRTLVINNEKDSFVFPSTDFSPEMHNVNHVLVHFPDLGKFFKLTKDNVRYTKKTKEKIPYEDKDLRIEHFKVKNQSGPSEDANDESTKNEEEHQSSSQTKTCDYISLEQSQILLRYWTELSTEGIFEVDEKMKPALEAFMKIKTSSNSKVELKKALKSDQPPGFKDPNAPKKSKKGSKQKDAKPAEEKETIWTIPVFKRKPSFDGYVELFKAAETVRDFLTPEGSQFFQKMIQEATPKFEETIKKE